MTGRRVCLSCGASYHVSFNPPKRDGKCDVCGSEVIQRADDTAATVNKRLDVYEAQTQPLIDYYTGKGLLSKVDGTHAINDVFKSICTLLDNMN